MAGDDDPAGIGNANCTVGSDLLHRNKGSRSAALHRRLQQGFQILIGHASRSALSGLDAAELQRSGR